MANMAAKVNNEDADKSLRRIEGIINSMTPLKRRKPELIKATRKKRIAEVVAYKCKRLIVCLTSLKKRKK